MLDVLLGGRLHGAVTERTASNGHKFATGVVRAADRECVAHFFNFIVFAVAPRTALLSLSDGASVVLSGELTIKTYSAADGSTRPSFNLLVHECLTEYHVMRRRRAIRGTPGSEPLPFDDALPDLTGAA